LLESLYLLLNRAHLFLLSFTSLNFSVEVLVGAVKVPSWCFRGEGFTLLRVRSEIVYYFGFAPYRRQIIFSGNRYLIRKVYRWLWEFGSDSVIGIVHTLPTPFIECALPSNFFWPGEDESL